MGSLAFQSKEIVPVSKATSRPKSTPSSTGVSGCMVLSTARPANRFTPAASTKVRQCGNAFTLGRPEIVKPRCMRSPRLIANASAINVDLLSPQARTSENAVQYPEREFVVGAVA